MDSGPGRRGQYLPNCGGLRTSEITSQNELSCHRCSIIYFCLSKAKQLRSMFPIQALNLSGSLPEEPFPTSCSLIPPTLFYELMPYLAGRRVVWEALFGSWPYFATCLSWGFPLHAQHPSHYLGVLGPSVSFSAS